MGLVEKQALHARRLALLILYAESLGYIVTGGDWYRDPRCPYGSKYSKHRERLATDLNLFVKDENGKWEYQTDSEAHRELGAYWKIMGGTWGGDFSSPDGNHYETI